MIWTIKLTNIIQNVQVFISTLASSYNFSDKLSVQFNKKLLYINIITTYSRLQLLYIFFFSLIPNYNENKNFQISAQIHKTSSVYNFRVTGRTDTNKEHYTVSRFSK